MFDEYAQRVDHVIGGEIRLTILKMEIGYQGDPRVPNAIRISIHPI